MSLKGKVPPELEVQAVDGDLLFICSKQKARWQARSFLCYLFYPLL